MYLTFVSVCLTFVAHGTRQNTQRANPLYTHDFGVHQFAVECLLTVLSICNLRPSEWELFTVPIRYPRCTFSMYELVHDICFSSSLLSSHLLSLTGYQLSRGSFYENPPLLCRILSDINESRVRDRVTWSLNHPRV